MSLSLNQVTLVGRAGGDADSKFTPSGTQIASFSLVTSEWNAKEKKEIPTWHNIKCIGVVADIASKRVLKGSIVALSGKIVVNNWTDDNGAKKSKTEILVNTISVDMPKKNNEDDASGNDNSADNDVSGGESDLPF